MSFVWYCATFGHNSLQKKKDLVLLYVAFLMAKARRALIIWLSLITYLTWEWQRIITVTCAAEWQSFLCLSHRRRLNRESFVTLPLVYLTFYWLYYLHVDYNAPQKQQPVTTKLTDDTGEETWLLLCNLAVSDVKKHGRADWKDIVGIQCTSLHSFFHSFTGALWLFCGSSMKNTGIIMEWSLSNSCHHFLDRDIRTAHSCPEDH